MSLLSRSLLRVPPIGVFPRLPGPGRRRLCRRRMCQRRMCGGRPKLRFFPHPGHFVRHFFRHPRQIEPFALVQELEDLPDALLRLIRIELQRPGQVAGFGVDLGERRHRRRVHAQLADPSQFGEFPQRQQRVQAAAQNVRGRLNADPPARQPGRLR